MNIEMTPSVYLALCALVKDAMEVDSDATPVLHQAARQLAAAMSALDGAPPELDARRLAIADMAAAARKTAA